MEICKEKKYAKEHAYIWKKRLQIGLEKLELMFYLCTIYSPLSSDGS